MKSALQKTSSQSSSPNVGGNNNALVRSLIVVIFVQWALFTSILIHRHHYSDGGDPSQLQPDGGGHHPLPPKTAKLVDRTTSVVPLPTGIVGVESTGRGGDGESESHRGDVDVDVVPSPSNDTPVVYAGVAATLMLDAPRWFQRRYSFIVSNALVNTPSDWAVQIFHTGSGQSRVGMDINPGLTRLANDNRRVILTEIPEEMWRRKGTKKKMLYWTDEWMWSAMVADRVLVFGGNGAICSNSRMSLLVDNGEDDPSSSSTAANANKFLLDVDYVGCPWRRHWGRGGDGTVSYRNRTAMIDAIRHRPHDGSEREDSYFVKTLLDMNKNEGTTSYYRVASKEQTEVFCGARSFNETRGGPPMVISGTLPDVDHDVREAVLEQCPELKVIFPSLHNPSCFGAHPNGEECARHICALSPPETRRGGC